MRFRNIEVVVAGSTLDEQRHLKVARDRVQLNGLFGLIGRVVFPGQPDVLWLWDLVKPKVSRQLRTWDEFIVQVNDELLCENSIAFGVIDRQLVESRLEHGLEDVDTAASFCTKPWLFEAFEVIDFPALVELGQGAAFMEVDLPAFDLLLKLIHFVVD